MKKVLLINGSSHKDGCTVTALKEIQKTLLKESIESDLIHLGTKAITDCMACGYCSSHDGCVINDDLVNEIAQKLPEYAGMVIGSPVYYSGPSARLQAFMDRLFYSVEGEKLDGMFGASVVSCRRGGNSATFERLNQYFLISNMNVIGSQYWNMIHGFTKEDALKDLEGLQTMRALASNIAYYMRMQEAAEKLGVKKPVRETRVGTHFMTGK